MANSARKKATPKRPAGAKSTVVKRYGKQWRTLNSELAVELFCLNHSLRGRPPVKSTAYNHFREVQQIVFPSRIWHPWSESRISGFTENKSSIWVGCGGSGKTDDAAWIAHQFYMADPANTTVILTSTTRGMIKKRMWPVITRLYHEAIKTLGEYPGYLVDSKTMIQAQKGDEKHGIFAIAVKDGNSSKAAADIQGIHSPRMLLIIDEATDTPEAIFEVIPNLNIGCDDFRLIVIGNPNSHLDPLGMCAEPKDGWQSVSIEDESWETQGVKKWGVEPGVCVRFDMLKSPNVLAGSRIYPFLPTEVDWQNMPTDSPQFWKYKRGFWAPEGVCRTIFSDAMVAKHGGLDKHVFKSFTTPVAFLDPAFGGDKCKLKFGEFGNLMDNRIGLQLKEGVSVPISALSKEPIHYQIASYVINRCIERHIEPSHFAMDTTGEGGGTADIITKLWSERIGKPANIVRVEFGGAPSEMPVSEEDNRAANEVYDRKVTELYFSARNYLISGQLKGLERDECVQFKSREYNDEKRKIKLDTKAECKEKIGHSPDDADAVVVGIELMRRLGFIAGGQSSIIRDHVEQAVKDAAKVYENADYTEDSVALDYSMA